MSASDEHVSIINSQFVVPPGMGVLQVAIFSGRDARMYIEIPEQERLVEMEVQDSSNAFHRFLGVALLFSLGRTWFDRSQSELFCKQRATSDSWFECMASIEALERFKESFSSQQRHSGRLSMRKVLHNAFDSMGITPEYHIKKTSVVQEEMEHTSIHQI